MSAAGFILAFTVAETQTHFKTRANLEYKTQAMLVGVVAH